jgi:hypothetical protein
LRSENVQIFRLLLSEKHSTRLGQDETDPRKVMFKITLAIFVIGLLCAQIASGTRIAAMYEQTNEAEQSASSKEQKTCCPIFELRQYTLHPGKRDVLIDLFDREFVESQEATGMDIVGQFRDLDDPNRFVWFRGFRDMPSRARALEDFYGGPVWQKHREAANATMIDVRNVLLLHPARPGSGFEIKGDRPQVGTKQNSKGLVVGTICYFDDPVTDDFVGFFEGKLKPLLIDAGASILASFVTDHSVNTFPRLPVREGENVFVWFSAFRDQAAYDDYLTAVLNSMDSQTQVWDEFAHRIKTKPEVLKLSPTARSRLRG